MPDWHTDKLVIVNDPYDRDNASDGHSRYGAYLRQNANLFRDAWSDEPRPVEDPAEFAVHAWRVATGPIMVPGYVQVRPDLHGITLHRDQDDHALYADIHVPLRHHHIGGNTKRFPYAWQDWEKESSWGEDGRYRGQLEPQPGKKPAVLATAIVRVPGRDWPSLPVPSAYEGRTLVNEAREAVSLVAAYINETAGPMVALILGEDA